MVLSGIHILFEVAELDNSMSVEHNYIDNHDHILVLNDVDSMHQLLASMYPVYREQRA